MRLPIFLLQILLAIVPVGCGSAPLRESRIGSEEARPPAGQTLRFEADVDRLIVRSREDPSACGGVMLVGSSIFRLWKSAEADLGRGRTVNHAFGGSRTWELVASMDRLVIDFRPSVVVCYCGSNDINAGQPAVEVAARIHVFMKSLEAALPEIEIVYVSINRAPQKRDRWDVVDEANRLITKICEARPNRIFVDVNRGLQDESGDPRLDYYLDDGLHFNSTAYLEVFAPAVRTAIGKAGHDAAWTVPGQVFER